MPVRSAGKKPTTSLSYDTSVMKSEPRMPGAENFLQLACRVATLRLERGYLVKIYDVSSAQLTKPLRRQLRENYDAKKVRNNFFGGHCLPVLLSSRSDPWKAQTFRLTPAWTDSSCQCSGDPFARRHLYHPGAASGRWPSLYRLPSIDGYFMLSNFARRIQFQDEPLGIESTC